MTATTRTSSQTGPVIARIIGGAMIAGVTAFALFAWYRVQSAGPMSEPATFDALRLAFPLVAVGSLTAAGFLWRTRVTPLLTRVPAPDDPDADRHDMALQRALIVHWALMESPALFGIAVYLLAGWIPAYIAGLLIVWLGIGLFMPRAHWYSRPAVSRQ